MNLLKSLLLLIRSIILALILVALVIFLTNNRDTILIYLHPLPFEIETKVFVVMLSFFILGMLFGILSCSQTIIKTNLINFMNRRKIKKLEKEIVK